jgi:hypothetical protein
MQLFNTLEQFLDECRKAWARSTERVQEVKVS